MALSPRAVIIDSQPLFEWFSVYQITQVFVPFGSLDQLPYFGWAYRREVCSKGDMVRVLNVETVNYTLSSTASLYDYNSFPFFL
jgi:hypothetical protein